MKNNRVKEIVKTQSIVTAELFRTKHGEAKQIDPAGYKATPLSGQELRRFRARMFLRKQGREFPALTSIRFKPVLSDYDINCVLEIEEKLKNYVAIETNSSDTSIKEIDNE